MRIIVVKTSKRSILELEECSMIHSSTYDYLILAD